MMQETPGRKFKVCLVSISLAKGGAERSCAMLSRMLTGLGHEVHLVLLTDAVDFEYAGKLFNLGLQKKENENNIKRFFRLKKLRKYLLKEKFDFIIDHRPKNDISRELFYHKYIYKDQPRIYVTHSARADNYLTVHPEKFVKIANKNRLNVAVSRHIENELLKKSGISNTATVHNAYDPQWAEDGGTIPEFLTGKKYILYYGRIDDGVKDLMFLIRAFTFSKLWREDIYLVLLGEGKDKEGLKEFCSHEPSKDFIRFEDFTANPFAIIKNALFTTLTSKYEGFPMVLTESLSLGTPIVSLDIVSGPSEVIQSRQNGLLVPERSIPLFSDAMREMALDKKLRTYCETNAKSSVKAFSMDSIALKWDNFLQHAT